MWADEVYNGLIVTGCAGAGQLWTRQYLLTAQQQLRIWR